MNNKRYILHNHIFICTNVGYFIRYHLRNKFSARVIESKLKILLKLLIPFDSSQLYSQRRYLYLDLLTRNTLYI